MELVGAFVGWRLPDRLGTGTRDAGSVQRKLRHLIPTSIH